MVRILENCDSTSMRGICFMLRKSIWTGRTIAVLAYLTLASLPFIYALGRLQVVTGHSPWEAFWRFSSAYGAMDALSYTLLEATASFSCFCSARASCRGGASSAGAGRCTRRAADWRAFEICVGYILGHACLLNLWTNCVRA